MKTLHAAALALGLALAAGCSPPSEPIVDGTPVPGGNGAINLEQGWSREVQARAWFTSFGSRLIPTAWLEALEQPGKTERFMADAHMDALGFLVQSATPANPQAFPVGFTQAGEVGPGGPERLLHGILRVVVVAQDPIGDRVEPVDPVARDGVERIGVASGGPSDQLLVHRSPVPAGRRPSTGDGSRRGARVHSNPQRIARRAVRQAGGPSAPAQRRSNSVPTSAARIGRGIFLDHATGLVVGATAVIEDNVSMLQDVTLGGGAAQRRHPPFRVSSNGRRVLTPQVAVVSPRHRW